MNLKKSLLAVAVSVLAGSAYSTTINVGGVSWDPDHPIDLFATSTLYEQVVVLAGEELKGYGRITSINDNTGFCAGCELTYVFDGYKLVNSIPLTGGDFAFTGGSFKFYVDYANDATLGSRATYENGNLWLALSGADPLSLGGTLVGSTTIPGSATSLSGQGAGYLNVDLVGAAAELNFDTNTKFGADFSFTSSFQPLSNVLSDGMTHAGTANIQGNSVPEPGALALLGLGLAGLGLARRNAKRG